MYIALTRLRWPQQTSYASGRMRRVPAAPSGEMSVQGNANKALQPPLQALHTPFTASEDPAAYEVILTQSKQHGNHTQFKSNPAMASLNPHSLAAPCIWH